MPKAFTNDEIQILKNEIVQTGSKLFGHFGYEKTSIDQITEACGVAKGTFYRFFKAKDTFFLHCLTCTEKEIDREIFEPLIVSALDSDEMLKEVIGITFNLTDRYPILSAWNCLTNKKRFFRLMNPEQRKQADDTDLKRMERILSKIRREHPRFPWTEDDLKSLFRALFFLQEHMNVICSDRDKFEGFLTTVITRGLLHDQD